MNKKITWLKTGALLGGIFLSSCTPQDIQPIQTKQNVLKTRSVFVMGVRWEESFKDVKAKTPQILRSESLLEDTELVIDRRIDGDSSLLNDSLHYISRIRLEMENGDEESELLRFHRDLNGYETIGIYETKPGQLELASIKIGLEKFKESQEWRSPNERWYPYTVELEENYGSWNLQPGGVYYLGELTLYFKTEKTKVGLLDPEIVNEKITVTGILMQDKFEQAREELKTKKPWFPADKMINLAAPEKQWFHKKIIEATDELTAPEQEEERKNSEKYIF